MKHRLADYKKDDGYEDDRGSYCEDAESLIQAGILGFCVCGCPEENLAYIRGGLELIGEEAPDNVDPTAWKEWWASHKKRCEAHFKSTGAEYFFYYWCDKEGFSEHGGAVPGWLTDEGRNLLGLLREFGEIQDE